jgi:hypothetical protein
VMRTITELFSHGLLKKHARRDGAPVLWVPDLMDMTPSEAVRRAQWIIRDKRKDEDFSAYFGQESAPVGCAKSGTPYVPGCAKSGTSGGAESGTHNTVSNNLSLRERAPAPSPAEELHSRGARLQHDWQASQADRELGRRYGLSDQQIGIEEIKFRNYWTAKTGKDATKISWPRTWENWIIRAVEHCRPAGGSSVESRVTRPDPRTFTNERWRRNGSVLLKEGGDWPEQFWGPPPGEPGCLMPEPLQLELGLVGAGPKAADVA